MALVLAAWAFGGDVHCANLSEKCVACYRAIQKMSASQEIDWMEYYKKNGYQINSSAYGAGRINYAPVFVSPTMQWAVPNSSLSGPPVSTYGLYPNQ